MNCLYCGKVLDETVSKAEYECGWHERCIKRFFGTDKMPEIDISKEKLEQLAQETADQGLTVPGVQKKLSLHLTNERNAKLTLVNYPTGYILKPQTDMYKHLPESEYLIMSMAEATGIKTVPFALVKMDGSYAYITRRVDREKSKSVKVKVKKLAMEDFCQLDGKLTENKYIGSYERCGKIIAQHSFMPMLDEAELFLRLVFCYVVGNSDMHLKNFSLIETKFKSGEYRLSPAYDMLPVQVVAKDQEDVALTLNGKKKNLRKNDFLTFADNIGLQDKVAERLMDKVVKLEKKYITMCQNSYLTEEMKAVLCSLISERIEKIK